MTRPSLLAVVIAAAAAIATADAAVARQWDVVAVLALLDALVAVQLGRQVLGLPTIRLRRDLNAWAEERAAVTGERVDRIVNRAVAEHRRRLDGHPGSSEPRRVSS